ncbi:hypothetical protein B0H19DRAFT_1169978 [Mycena capillaripes]|nr:hypothetical protein B0H19DRAFT_1169978 [Mycena capillaripes]
MRSRVKTMWVRAVANDSNNTHSGSPSRAQGVSARLDQEGVNSPGTQQALSPNLLSNSDVNVQGELESDLEKEREWEGEEQPPKPAVGSVSTPQISCKTGDTMHNKLKRKRETSSDGAVVPQTAHSAPGPTKGPAAAHPGNQTESPAQWTRIFNEASLAGTAVPPPSVVQKFAQYRENYLRDFQNAQPLLHKAVSTCERFVEASSDGATPSLVSSHIKLPAIQIMKGAAGIELDLPSRRQGRREKAIASASVACTKYLSEVFPSQVAAIRKLVHVPTVSDEFAVSLKAYSARIISDAAGADTALWDAVIERIKAALILELESLNHEFAAMRARDAEAGEAELEAADVEMTDATRRVEEILDEKLDAHAETGEKD